MSTLSAADGSHIAITIADTGIGISSEMLPRVFDMFTQADSPTERQHGGLGIGLALARRLAELHGGTIVAHSDGPGKGSTFTITMPASLALTAQPSASRVELPRLACRVQIIDDNRDAAQTLAMLVEALGGSAAVAHDATKGLLAIGEHQPDVVFLDIGMPGIDGYEACRRIRQLPLGREVVVVAVTGWGQSQDKQRALEAGFDTHLTKPVDLDALAGVLIRIRPRHAAG